MPLQHLKKTSVLSDSINIKSSNNSCCSISINSSISSCNSNSCRIIFSDTQNFAVDWPVGPCPRQDLFAVLLGPSAASACGPYPVWCENSVPLEDLGWFVAMSVQGLGKSQPLARTPPMESEQPEVISPQQLLARNHARMGPEEQVDPSSPCTPLGTAVSPPPCTPGVATSSQAEIVSEPAAREAGAHPWPGFPTTSCVQLRFEMSSNGIRVGLEACAPADADAIRATSRDLTERLLRMMKAGAAPHGDPRS